MQYPIFHRLLHSIGKVQTEFKFSPNRKFRADFAFVEQRILIEVEGGIYTNGRHTRGAGYTKDMEKYNLAAELGYVVLRYSPNDLLKSATFEQIKRVYDLQSRECKCRYSGD